MLICPLCSGSATLLCIDAQNQKHYSHCARCDLRFLHPVDRLTFHEEKAQYDHHNNDVNDPRYQKFVSPVCEAISRIFHPGASGLDYGAGPGPVLTKMLRESGYAVNLYDPIYWPETSVLKKTYDFIVASEVAEHFHNPLVEFQRFYGLLKNGGALVLMTLLVNEKTEFESWFYRKDPTHVVFYSEKALIWIKEKIGFTSIESDSKRLIVLRKAAGE